MKRLEAVVAATIITGVVALSMLLVGINALFNPNSVAVNNSAVSTTLNTTTANVDQSQVAQWQNLIA